MLELKNIETNTRLIVGESYLDICDHFTDESYKVKIEWGVIPGSYEPEEYSIASVKKGDKYYTDKEMEKIDKDWGNKRTAIYSLFLSYKPYKPHH